MLPSRISLSLSASSLPRQLRTTSIFRNIPTTTSLPSSFYLKGPFAIIPSSPSSSFTPSLIPLLRTPAIYSTFTLSHHHHHRTMSTSSTHHAPHPPAPDASHDVPFPTIDEQLGERLQHDEAHLATQMANVIEQGIHKQYPAGTQARRDVHARSTSVLRAVFRVHDDIPAQFAKGVFVPGKSYETIIRLSNGSGDAKQNDKHDDARGFAIKLLGVPGEKVLESDKHAQTQDFVMINHPFFLTNMSDRYLALLEKSQGTLLQKATIPFTLGWKGTVNAGLISSGKISNPLQIQYYSTVPFQLGVGPDRQAVKYSIKPVSSQKDPLPPANAPDHFLVDAAKATLAKGPVEFIFMIQTRKGPHMDVEDSMTEWSEQESPFHPVATITVPQQDVSENTPLFKMGERLSFNPWHCLPEHRPLGSINRARKVVYERISRVRDAQNGVVREEPTSIPTA